MYVNLYRYNESCRRKTKTTYDELHDDGMDPFKKKEDFLKLVENQDQLNELLECTNSNTAIFSTLMKEAFTRKQISTHTFTGASSTKMY